MPLAALVETVVATLAVAAAHDEHLHRLADFGGVFVLEPAVEPLQLQVQEIVVVAQVAAAEAEMHVAARRVEVVVRPRSDQQILVLAFQFAPSSDSRR